MKPLKSTAPPTSLLSPQFRYTPAAATDVRVTFERIRREQDHARAQRSFAPRPPELAAVIAIGKVIP